MSSSTRSPARRSTRSLARLASSLLIALVVLTQVAVGKGYRIDVGSTCRTGAPEQPADASSCCCGPSAPGRAGACEPKAAERSTDEDSCDCRITPEPTVPVAVRLPLALSGPDASQELAVRIRAADRSRAVLPPALLITGSTKPGSVGPPGRPPLIVASDPLSARARQRRLPQALAELSTWVL